ncbi:MAG: hypothetical protein CBC40_07630 [bacterium TMED80]|nr:MAG: hypothetical protein CBC40_07630 [bacterium TMED80]
MNDICKITTLTLFFLSLSFGQTKKEKEIIKFLNARYNASLDSVVNYLDQNFIYYHTPYVGMGISSELIEDKLTVTSVSPFIKSNKPIKISDVILKINNLKPNITKNREFINKIIIGAQGDSLNLKLSRSGNVFNCKVFFARQQLKQKAESFLIDIKTYGDRWYDYDIDIIDIFSKKNKVVVHYKWEGSLEKNGSIYSFNAMEIIKTSVSGKNVKEISSVWTEKQFLDQFK